MASKKYEYPECLVRSSSATVQRVNQTGEDKSEIGRPRPHPPPSELALRPQVSNFTFSDLPLHLSLEKYNITRLHVYDEESSSLSVDADAYVAAFSTPSGAPAWNV